MKMMVVHLLFFVVYFGGVLVFWNIPELNDGFSVIFVILWFVIVRRVLSRLAVIVGWAGKIDRGP